MIICCFSDCHLGRKIFRKMYNNLNAVENAIYNQWFRFINDVIESKPDLLLIAGDLFDKKDPTSIALNKALIGFKILDENNIKTYVVGGNHDFGYDNYLNDSHIFKNIDIFQNIKFIYKDYLIEQINDELSLFILPHQALKLNEDDLKINYENIHNIWEDSIFQIKKMKGKKIFLSHGVLESSMESLIGEISEEQKISNMIIPDEFILKFDYSFIGHIHYPSVSIKNKKGKKFIITPGAIFNEDLEESNDPILNTGPIYIDLENNCIQRHIINSVKKYNFYANNLDELCSILNDVTFNKYNIEFEGDLRDIPINLYNNAKDRALLLNINTKRKYQYKKNNEEVGDFWNFIMKNYPNYYSEFKNKLLQEN